MRHNARMNVQRISVTRVTAGVSVAGELYAQEDIEIHGHIDGQVNIPDHHVRVQPGAMVRAKIVASSVTISGNVDGSVTAARVVIEPTAVVRGHVVTPELTLREGAQFNGSVDPVRTEAAIHVAKYRQKHPDTAKTA